MGKSKISWTEKTWNPVTGCTKISAGCKNCYAEKMAKRLQAMGQEKYKNGFSLTIHPKDLEAPLRWKKPSIIFVNSMSDLFHARLPIDYILSVFDVMRRADWHTFHVLTKRSERLAAMSYMIDWPDNVWMGVSVESDEYYLRIDHLRRTRAKIKFVSFEPLIGKIYYPDLLGIDWAIVGGESGPGAREMDLDWAREIKNACAKSQTAFYMKQAEKELPEPSRDSRGQYVSGHPNKRDKLEDLPEDLRVREYPL